MTLPTDEEIDLACAQWARFYFSWSDNVPEREVDSGCEGFRAAIQWLRNKAAGSVDKSHAPS